MFPGPVFWMELRGRARRPRFYIARTLFLAGLTGLVIFAYLDFDAGNVSHVRGRSLAELARLGDQMFRSYALGLAIALALLTPVYCAGAIAADREQRVLELLFLTQLRNAELIAGKFLVRLLDLVLLVAATIPAITICALLGGIRWQGLFETGCLMFAFVACVASASLLVSIFASRVISAVILTFCVFLVLWIALPMLVAMSYAAGPPPTAGWAGWVFILNPAVALVTILFSDQPGSPWPDAPFWSVVVYSAAAMLLLAVAVVIVRVVGIWASQERAPRGRLSARDARRQRQVWRNPVLWREVQTIAVHRRLRVARLGALVALVMLSGPLWLTYLADVMISGSALAQDFGLYQFVVMATAVIAWTLMALQGSLSFAYERDRGTLDGLLTTPLSGMAITLGKLAGILRSSAFALVFPLGFAALAWQHQIVSGRAAAVSAAIIVAAAVLAAAAGLFVSIAVNQTMRATTTAIIGCLVLLVAAPMAHASLNFRTQWVWLPLAQISPVINLSWAFFETPSYASPYGYYERQSYFPQWDQRLPASLIEIGAQLALAATIVGLAARHIETRHRTTRLKTAGRPLANTSRVSATGQNALPAPLTPARS